MKRWRATHPETDRSSQLRARSKPEARFKKSRWSIQSKYGVDAEWFDATIIQQCGRCPICNSVLKSPHVDHDHATGMVRAILCSRCNTAIGHLENTEWRAAATRYLAEHGKGG